MPEVKEDSILDCRGQLCPMPVVRVGQALSALGQGQVIKVFATDRGAIADIPAWAEDTDNELVHWHDEGSHLVFYVRKGGDPAAQ